jgi:hypothetical protein
VSPQGANSEILALADLSMLEGYRGLARRAPGSRVDGVPAAASSRLISHGVGMIVTVGTRSEYHLYGRRAPER